MVIGHWPLIVAAFKRFLRLRQIYLELYTQHRGGIRYHNLLSAIIQYENLPPGSESLENYFDIFGGVWILDRETGQLPLRGHCLESEGVLNP